MANGAPLSVAAADRHLRKVIYGFWAACCSIVLGVLALGTVRRLPPGLALFLAGFFILLGIVSFLSGLVELVRRSMGVKVHVEDQGPALYPSLGARRAHQAMAALGISCAPIALIIEYALGGLDRRLHRDCNCRLHYLGFAFRNIHGFSLSPRSYPPGTAHAALPRVF